MRLVIIVLLCGHSFFVLGGIPSLQLLALTVVCRHFLQESIAVNYHLFSTILTCLSDVDSANEAYAECVSVINFKKGIDKAACLLAAQMNVKHTASVTAPQNQGSVKKMAQLYDRLHTLPYGFSRQVWQKRHNS